MRPEFQRTLDEVCASYSYPPGDHARCHLFTCREDGECAFPNLCLISSSDLSSDGKSMDEAFWRQEGERHGWDVPERRPWYGRLPVIRHIGALVLSWKVHTYAGGWAEVGIGVGGPHPRDLWVVEGAYNGYW